MPSAARALFGLLLLALAIVQTADAVLFTPQPENGSGPNATAAARNAKALSGPEDFSSADWRPVAVESFKQAQPRPPPWLETSSSSRTGDDDRRLSSSGHAARPLHETVSVAVSAVPSAYYGEGDMGAHSIFHEDSMSWYDRQSNGRFLYQAPEGAARQLLMSTTYVQEGGTAFENFAGVVKLDIYTKNPRTVCTAVMIAPTVLLTAPACFKEEEAPLTVASNYEGSSSTLAPYPVVAGDGTVLGYANFHYYVYNTGQEGYRLSIVNMTRLRSSFYTDPVTGQLVSKVPYYAIATQDLEPPKAGYSGGFGPNNITTVALDVVPLGVGVQRMANVTLTGRGQSVKRIGKCSGVRIGGNLYTDRIARLRDSYVRMCGQFGDMGAPLLFDAGNQTLVGGTLIDVDVYPCATNKATYTSIPFRQEWIKARMQLLQTVVTYEPEYCPTASQTPTMTGTRTMTMTPSTSMIINVTIIIPPPEPPFPWWFVAAIGSAILGLIVIAGGIYWYVRRTLRIMRAAQGYDKAYFSRPHKDQIAPAPEFKSLQKDKLFKATAADLGGLKKDEDPANVADEIFASAQEEGGDMGAKAGGLYKQKLTSDEFMKRLQKRIARKTARVAPGGASTASSSTGSQMDTTPSKSKILEARDRNNDFAATTRSLRPRFNPSAVVSGSATINAEIPDMLMLSTPAVFMPLASPMHPVGSGSSALGAKVAAARTAANRSAEGSGPVLIGPTGAPIPFVPMLPIPQHPNGNGSPVPLSVTVASPGGSFGTSSNSVMMIGSPQVSHSPRSPILVPHYSTTHGSGSPPPILGFGSSYVATAVAVGASGNNIRSPGPLPISIAVSTGAPLSPYNGAAASPAYGQLRSPSAPAADGYSGSPRYR